MYAKGAARQGVTAIRAVELEHWSVELTRHIEERIPNETPHRRASLLYSLGFLGLHPTLTDEQLPDASVCDVGSDDIAAAPPPWALLDVTLPQDYVCRDAPGALSAWTELVENLENTPLFPLQTLAALLQLLLPLWSTQPEWRRLVDLIDDEIGAREGRHAVAKRARVRAMALMNDGRNLEALEELHRARVDWWSGDTARETVLASLVIARLYQQLRLYTAAKAYALAAATIAASGDEELADLLPDGLLMAALAEFLSGAWYGAAELYGLGLTAQYVVGRRGTDLADDVLTDGAVIHLVHISLCARQIDSALQSAVQAIVDRTGIQNLIAEVINHVPGSDGRTWDTFGDGALADPPFSDLGDTRCIRFAALGTKWTLLADNDHNSVRVAERFAAGVQTMLAALAREDLCLIPTDITIKIQRSERADSTSSENIEAVPSNQGRQWRVRLTPTGSLSDTSRESINTQLMTVLTTILREASLLPADEFLAVMQRTFERGLGHKLSAAVQLEEFVANFSIGQDDAISRRSFDVPWECPEGIPATSEELRWQDGPGPTYSRDKAIELLRTRYENLAQFLRFTAVVLSSADEFKPTVQALRADGWLDWHILTAIANITLNYRFPLSSTHTSEKILREMMQSASNPESATADPVPVSQFTLERMRTARHAAMLNLLTHWGLECHQRTPDFPAIERLLAARCGYWDEDVPHADPFPELDEPET